MNWLHEFGYFGYTWMLAGLAYDGLVAYRRVSGAAGATLVGGLATRPPAPSPDGRTYVFTLRRGIRYSDGTPVRPGDFRASMERYLRVSRGRVPALLHRDRRRTALHQRAGALRPLARHRVGRARGDDHGPPDRARPGLPPQADDAVRVHRASRHARAQRCRGLRPARHGPVPHRCAGTRAAAACSSATRTSGRPPRGRPASRIGSRSRSAGCGRLETHTAAIERGSADLTWLGDFPLRGHLPDLVARAPGRLHSSPAPGTWWMFLNVQRPPFDDPRVRQAINFATDRAALVERYGGPQAAAPTCQIVPRRVPGLLALLSLHRQLVARRRMDRAGPRARPPPGRGVGPGRRERDRGRRR